MGWSLWFDSLSLGSVLSWIINYHDVLSASLIEKQIVIFHKVTKILDVSKCGPLIFKTLSLLTEIKELKVESCKRYQSHA